MGKYIDKLLRVLKLEILLVWIIALVAVVLGEIGVIPNGCVPPATNTEMVLNTVVVVLTIVGIPLAIRLFTLNTTHGLRRMNNDEALVAYHVWSGLRMGILCVAAVFSVVVYYLTISTSCAFCALITLCVTLYCWPSRKKIVFFLQKANSD